MASLLLSVGMRTIGSGGGGAAGINTLVGFSRWPQQRSCDKRPFVKDGADLDADM